MKSWKGRKRQEEINNNSVDCDKYYTLAVNANNWRKTCFSLIILIVLLIAGLIKVSITNKVETFVIEKNGNNYSVVGNVIDVAQTQNKVTDGEIIYFLNELISNAKTLPKSEEIYAKNYKKSLYYLSKSASSKFDNYLKEEKYVEKKRQGKTVEIVFNTGLKVSDNTYQIRWKQITYSPNGELEDVVNYNGLLTIGFKAITDSKVLYKNPLGLIVTEFSQKKELL